MPRRKAWQIAEDEVAAVLQACGYRISGRVRNQKGHEYKATRETSTLVQVKSHALELAKSHRTRRDYFNGGARNRDVTVFVNTYGPRPWPMLAVPSSWMDECADIRTRRYHELGPDRKLSRSGKVSEELVLATRRILIENAIDRWDLAAIAAAGTDETPERLKRIAYMDARPPR